jgi:3',5'-cyclic AMP phosphodiesterase CpdA
MLIAHISDFHIFADQPETSLVRLDAAEAARRVVKDMARFTPALDVVAFTGDLADGGSAADYALLKDILYPLRIPIYVIPGNHDKRANFRDAFAQWVPFEDGKFLNYESRFKGVRILALDTLIEGRGEGALEPESIDWLTRKLAVRTPDPTIILLHHTPFPSGITSLDKASLVRGRDELGTLVRSYAGPLSIFAGHIHRPYQAIWNGAYCAVGGSPAFQIGLDLTGSEREPSRVSEPYAYYVYRFSENGNSSIHTRFVPL